MSTYQSLNVLNKSSAKLAKFLVRPSGGRVVSYEYLNKKSQMHVTAHKFEVYLIGEDAQHYCIGYVKAQEGTCKAAMEKYTHDTLWELSSVALDTYTKAEFISSPIPFRVDLAKSKMEKRGSVSSMAEEKMPDRPVPPRTVADVSCITTNRSTDLIAMVKGIQGPVRQSKTGQDIVDVLLLDNSTTKSELLATIVVSVFGSDKVAEIQKSLGKPLVFFNLTISCKGRDAKPSISHFANELMQPAPTCEKTDQLRQKETELSEAQNLEQLTSVWAPTATRDVAGPQTLSCAAFLDLTSETPKAQLPEVNQLMWVCLEEPAPENDILDSTGTRIWYRRELRDMSGSVTVGVPQRCAIKLASCCTKEEFVNKHKAGQLNFPLLCQARVSRVVRPMNNDVGSVEYVNHNLEDVEPVSWSRDSAPNASYSGVLSILDHCPPAEDGVQFAYLSDIHSDPFHGARLVYDGKDGPKASCIAVLLASPSSSATTSIGDNAFKVVTEDVKDIASPRSTLEKPVGQHRVIGYCSLDNLPLFSLDPPRGKKFRVAIALITKVDNEGLHVHKLEYIEPEQVVQAVDCMQKLRKLSKSILSNSSEKRSHAVSLEQSGMSPNNVKKARTLHRAPTDESLDSRDASG